MKRFRHFLIATDFSDPAELAVHALPQIGGGEGTRVTIVHVVAIPSLTFGDLAQDGRPAREAEAAVRKHLSRLRDALLPEITDVKTAIVHSSSPADAICELATDEDVDLILVGTTGRAGVARFLLGSVAERVVRHAPCPVLVLREKS